MESPQRATWPFAVAGAVAFLAVLVSQNVGEYEGSDVIVVLGPLAVLVGALLGALVGRLVNRR